MISQTSTITPSWNIPRLVQLIALLERVKVCAKTNTLQCSDPAEAHAIFKTLDIPFALPLAQFELTLHKVEALLWPSVLEKAGVKLNKDGKLLIDKFNALYRSLSNPSQRAALEKLARCYNPVETPLKNTTLPTIDRSAESASVARSEQEAARTKSKDPSPKPNPKAENEKKTEVKAAAARAGLLRRVFRTTLTSTLILVGGLITYREYEKPITDEILSHRGANDLLDRVAPVTKKLEPISDQAFKLLVQLRDTSRRLLNEISDSFFTR